MTHQTTTKNDTQLIDMLNKALEEDQAAIKAGSLSLPKPEDFKTSLPLQLTDEAQKHLEETRNQIRQMIDGEDRTKLLIVGPCSPDFRGLSEGKIPAVLAFARELKETIEAVEREHDVLVVVRTPAVKPRTAVGWGGIFSDSPAAARILYTAMANEGIRLATEVYGQIQQDYLGDLCVLTWVGARNVSAPNTRTQVANATAPVLVKHSLTAIDSSIHARQVIAAQQPASGIDWETGRLTMRPTKGNRYTLTILRGYEHAGKHESNIDAETVKRACELSKEAELACGVVIDISHSNGNKSVEGSMEAFQKVLELMRKQDLNEQIRGIMIESYLGGKGDEYGESMTDPTIDIETTKKMMKQFAELSGTKE